MNTLQIIAKQTGMELPTVLNEIIADNMAKLQHRRSMKGVVTDLRMLHNHMLNTVKAMCIDIVGMMYETQHNVLPYQPSHEEQRILDGRDADAWNISMFHIMSANREDNMLWSRIQIGNNSDLVLLM